MTQGIKSTLANAFELTFQVANTRMKYAFLCLLETLLLYIIHQRALDTILIKSFDFLSQLDAFMDALVEKIHKHPVFPQDPSKRMGYTTERKIEDGWEKKN